MNANKYHVSKNLFDKSTVTFGKWYSDLGDLRDQPYGAISEMQTVSVENYTIKWYGLKPYSVSYVWFDSNKDFISRTYHGGTGGILDMYTDTVPSNAVYFILQMSNGTNTNIPITIEQLETYQTMLNTGSQPLPYEPYGDTWHDIPHYIHNTSTDTLTTLPADIYANDTTATVGLKGNMSQTGTPTPTTPIQPQECGDRTGNLFPLDENKLHVGRIENDGTIDYQIGTITVGTDSVSYQSTMAWRGFYTDFIQVNENEQLTFSPNISAIIAWSCDCYDENDSFLGKASAQSTASTRIFTLFTGTKKVRMSVTNSETAYTISQPMLVQGSTAPSTYIPYGYKIPILSGGTTTNVYLGEVESTRRIKKLVLTGEENWLVYTGKVSTFTTSMAMSRDNAGICSHYTPVMTAEFDVNTGFYVRNSALLIISDTRFTDVSDFKAYLAQQYAAGTPVTIWYVLAEPTTGIVNEPLRKIGDYADEVSGITIPTTTGANTLSVDTTLQPSEITVNYKGWHPVQSVHERESGQWD